MRISIPGDLVAHAREHGPGPRAHRLLDGDAAQLDGLFSQHRGVVDFGRVEVEPDEAGCREAIRQVFDELVVESKRYVANLRRKLNDPDLVCWEVWAKHDELTSELIDLRTFLGWSYDLKRRCVLLHGEKVIELFAAPYVEDESCLIFEDDAIDYFAPNDDLCDHTGFAYAFCAPPYGLRIDNPTRNRLFHDLADALFGGFDGPLQIRSWQTTGWTNYFDPGREWWGEFLWTVHRPGTPHVTVIAASSTD